jgi:DNA-binding NarL/FixJ family response regulator
MQCIQNGASGYLLKNTSMNEHRMPKRSSFGNIVFCNETKHIISKLSHTAMATPRLTKREKEILKLVRRKDQRNC